MINIEIKERTTEDSRRNEIIIVNNNEIISKVEKNVNKV